MPYFRPDTPYKRQALTPLQRRERLLQHIEAMVEHDGVEPGLAARLYDAGITVMKNRKWSTEEEDDA